MFPDLVHSGPTWAFILAGASGVVWGAIVSFLWHSPQFLSE